MAREPEHLTVLRRVLGRRLAHFAEIAGVTQQQLGDHTGYSRSSIAHVYRGSQTPNRDFWTNVDVYLHTGGELLTAYGKFEQAKKSWCDQEIAALNPAIPVAIGHGLVTPSSANRLGNYNSSVLEPIRDDDILAIRDTMRHLLILDGQFGGAEASRQGLRLFRSVQRRIGAAQCPSALERDLYATVGELAEIVGWSLYDAGDQDTMRRISQEALMYLDWAGDKSIKLLTLQNLSMHAEYLRRPAEALAITTRVPQTEKLSPRLESLFRARQAHALAQQKREGDALRELDHAQTLFYDGARNTDPPWAWWIDERQFHWFTAMTTAALGNRDEPINCFTEALAIMPERRRRAQYSYTAYLFDALINAHAWNDAEQVAEKPPIFVEDVGSGRTAAILRGTVQTIAKTPHVPPSLKDAAHHIATLTRE